MSRKKKEEELPYFAGTKGFNRVRAFEKRPGQYYIEYRDSDGRKKREVVTPATPQQARWRADERAVEIGGGYTGPNAVTLGQLLDRYHESHHSSWSRRHYKGQETLKAFWLDALGRNFRVTYTTMTPDAVRKQVSNAAKRREWTGRTQEAHLKYIRAAIRWAKRSARLIDHDHLDGLTYPKYDSRSETYTKEELDAISEVAAQVDSRFHVLWETLRDTGRRVGAVRKLEWADLDTEDQAINFPAATDKARKYGRAFVRPATLALMLAQRNGKPWVFTRDGGSGFVGTRVTYNWLRSAEALAGVETVPGRGYHGIKRRFVTAAVDAGLSYEEIGAVTGNQDDTVLKQVYDKHGDQRRRGVLKAVQGVRNE